METNISNKFNFFIPADIRKSKEGDKEDYYFEGLASDGSRDADGETMSDAIFDMDDRPYVNYNHKQEPEFTIGVLDTWDAKKGHLHVKGRLFPELPQAKATIQLMESLAKRGLKRLGISVEGRVLERDLIDRTKIKKARINGVALCLLPKNPSTWASLIQKGFTYTDPKTYIYDDDEGMLVNFVSGIGEYGIKKNGDTIIKSIKYTAETDNNFILLCKAYKSGLLDEIQKKNLMEYYKKYCI